ncbi:P-loop containing nucleoside triphosphate hydrolase protein [Mycena pura]|uniref:DNA 3'-5' helicase n=1 Tax=Mycena pura TaxID=153505 RepID=A0AAD6URU2_9AGAR|nr:P-loop containing nucleoside triphosphate hydrolase protein [Mycena pura]
MSTPSPSPLRRTLSPPLGTRHRVKSPRHRKVLPSSTRTAAQLVSVREELKLLPALVKKNYTKWTNGATACQLECMGSQVLGRDTILHAATGAGKTGIAAGPHLLPSSKGKVTLMVSPLLSLHEEQADTFQKEFGLKAIAINSAHGGCTKEIVRSIVAGEHQIVLISPEMLLTRRFIDGVLRKPEFGARCLAVFVDEAHCVSHWGDSFRKKYGSIGIIRAFLPRAVPIIAVSATLTPRVHDDILVKLRIDPKTYLYVNIGNDRSNVAHVVRAMEHPMNSHRDLDFLVDENMQVPKDIPLTFLYSDDTKEGAGIIDHLNDRVHPDYRARGLVRPYNASMSREYRDTIMLLFRAGIIRILVCTDAAGMGCDLPDIDIVVQWKAPANMSSWIQRLGRAARGPGRTGLAVMLVEKTAFEANATGKEEVAEVSEPAFVPLPAQPARGRGAGRGGRAGVRGRGGRGWGRGGRGRGKDYAVLHGQKRGTFSGKEDKISRLPEPEISAEAPGEGLYIYIQSTTCRRAIQTAIFRNDTPAVPVDPLKCCDLCNPCLFDRTRPSKPIAASRQQAVKKGMPVDSVRESLWSWRRSIKKAKYPRALFTPNAILDDDTCERLSSIGPVTSREQLAQQLEGWARWSALGEELFTFMSSLEIPVLVPRTRARAAAPEPARSSAASPIPPPPNVPSATTSFGTPAISHPRPPGPPPPPAKRARVDTRQPATTLPPMQSWMPFPTPTTPAPSSNFSLPSLYHYAYPNYYPACPTAYSYPVGYPYPSTPQPSTPQQYTYQAGPSRALQDIPYATMMSPSPFAPTHSNFLPRPPDTRPAGPNPPHYNS